MIQHASYLMALTVVVLAGLVHGNWTGRWSQSQALDAAVSRLDGIPAVVGDWEGRSLTLDRRQVEIGEIAGNVLRTYKNRRDGREVTVLVVCGRPGPISVHTPDICFGGAGYEATSSPVDEHLAYEPSTQAATFRTARFHKESAGSSSTLRAYWSWNAQGTWEAPENPRLAFASRPFLYKCYVVYQLPSAPEGNEGSVHQDFLRAFLPRLDQVLVAAPPANQQSFMLTRPS